MARKYAKNGTSVGFSMKSGAYRANRSYTKPGSTPKNGNVGLGKSGTAGTRRGAARMNGANPPRINAGVSR